MLIREATYVLSWVETLRSEGLPKQAGTWCFGNVHCQTLALHIIPLRKDCLTIPLNSHENQPGNKMNHSPCSHLLCSIFQLLKCLASIAPKSFSKLSWVPLLLPGFIPGVIFCYRAGKAVLHFPKGDMTCEKEEVTLWLSFTTSFESAVGEPRWVLLWKAFPGRLPEGSVFLWYWMTLKLAENATYKT